MTVASTPTPRASIRSRPGRTSRPASYSVGVELADFEHTAMPVTVAEGKPASIDFTLKSKPLPMRTRTASEIIAGLPGTDQQKDLVLAMQQLHTLQWALQPGAPRKAGRDHQGRWRPRRRARGPGTYEFSQKHSSSRGRLSGLDPRPESSDKIPFKQRPGRPMRPRPASW